MNCLWCDVCDIGFPPMDPKAWPNALGNDHALFLSPKAIPAGNRYTPPISYLPGFLLLSLLWSLNQGEMEWFFTKRCGWLLGHSRFCARPCRSRLPGCPLRAALAGQVCLALSLPDPTWPVNFVRCPAPWPLLPKTAWDIKGELVFQIWAPNLPFRAVLMSRMWGILHLSRNGEDCPLHCIWNRLSGCAGSPSSVRKSIWCCKQLSLFSNLCFQICFMDGIL